MKGEKVLRVDEKLKLPIIVIVYAHKSGVWLRTNKWCEPK
jgi:hypothetical protein